MLVLLSNLNLVTRIEIPVAAGVRDDLLQGSWITWGGVKSTSDQVGNVQVWTEASRAAEKAYQGGTAIGSLTTPRFSPDAEDTGALTVLYGKYRALTNIIHSSAPTQGQFMKINAAGVLEGFAPTSGSSQDAVAVCTKGSHKYDYLGTEYDVIEYVTI
jgi:hypothetical protein